MAVVRLMPEYHNMEIVTLSGQMTASSLTVPCTLQNNWEPKSVSVKAIGYEEGNGPFTAAVMFTLTITNLATPTTNFGFWSRDGEAVGDKFTQQMTPGVFVNGGNVVITKTDVQGRPASQADGSIAIVLEFHD